MRARSIAVDGLPIARVGEVVEQIAADDDGGHARILARSKWRAYAWRWSVLRWSLADGRLTVEGEGEGEGVGLAARAGRVFVGGRSWEIGWQDVAGGGCGAVPIEGGERFCGCSPDGRHVVTLREGAGRTWWCRIRAVEGSSTQFPEVQAPLVFSDDGRFAAYFGADERSLEWVSLADGERAALAIGAATGEWCGICPVRGAARVIVWDEARLVICDLDARRVVARVAVEGLVRVEDAAGQRAVIVTGYEGAGSVALLDLASGGRVGLPWTHARVALTGDGRRALVHRGRVLDVLDTTSGAVFSAHAGHCTTVRGLVWTTDGARVASSADDGRVRVLGGGEPRELAGERGEAPRVVFSPDGRRVYVVTAAAIEVADVASGAIVGRFASFGTHIHSAEITGDGRYLVTGSYSHGTRVVDVETGEQVAREQTATARASRLVVVEDGIVTMEHERLAGPKFLTPVELVHWVRLDLGGKVLERGSWRFEEAGGGVELCADGSVAMVAWYTRGGHRLCTNDLRTPERPGRVVAIPAGAKLVDAREGRALFLEADAVVCRDPGTGEEIWRIDCPRWPWHASLSHRGDAVAVAYHDQGVEVFSLSS